MPGKNAVINKIALHLVEPLLPVGIEGTKLRVSRKYE
jgi:hypothetical protein